jgi:2'-5' RNA ligase
LAAREKKLPTPLAATGTTTINREVIGDEYVRDLADIGQRMRIYTRMRRGDGAVNTSLLAIEKPILGARWEVAGEDDIAEACREELFSTDRGAHFDPPLLEMAVEHLLGMFQYGFAACEPFWELGPDGKVHCTNLTLIRQESVRTFRLDEAGRLKELVQYTSAIDDGWREISVPVDQLMMAVHAREGSDYSGVAIIRSSYRPFIERDTIRKTRLWHHDRFGAGTPVATYPEKATDAQKAEIDEALESFRAGSRTYLALPYGSDITLVGGSGSGLDPTPELSALASEIAKNTLSQLTELGTSGNSGNRALGESFAEVLRNALQGYAERIAAIVRRQLLTPFVKWNFGENAEVPKLTVRVTLGGVAELLAAIQMAVTAGLKLEPEDIASIRDELELPEIEAKELERRINERQVAADKVKRDAESGDDEDDEEKGKKPLAIAAGEHLLGERQYSSTQFDLPKRAASWLSVLQAKIADDDLAEAGRETDPHVTVRYGLHTEDPDDVREILADAWPATIEMGRTSFFQTPIGDAVFVYAKSWEVEELNERLAKLPHTTTHAEFIPHITLAYVKPGMGGKYADDNAVAGKVFKVNDLTFSSKNGTETKIPLGQRYRLTEPGPQPLEGRLPDYIGRMRPARVVEIEEKYVKPKLLAELLDREAVRASADVHDVLREIDAALVDQVKSLAQQGGPVLVEKIASVSVPPKLQKKLTKAIAGAAARAHTIGRDSVRAELERQGLDLLNAPITRRKSLMEWLFAPLVTLADPDLYGGLAAFLKKLIELAAEQELAARELAAKNAAMAAISAEATAAIRDSIDYVELARRVQSDLEDRSIAAVESRVTQTLNVSFGQGRAETGELFGSAIESHIRSAVLDGGTCDHCARHDGDEFTFGDPSAPDLPDPECEGRWRCRCIWFYELARRVA